MTIDHFYYWIVQPLSGLVIAVMSIMGVVMMVNSMRTNSKKNKDGDGI